MPAASFSDHGCSISSWGEVQQMKRRIAVVALVFMAFALIAQQALAQNEHFIRASANLNNNGTLTVSFKEAGLGTNQLITYVASADATAPMCVSTGAGLTPAPRTRPPWLAR
jgi:DNA-binding transcriptional regulator of glucitol operon